MNVTFCICCLRRLCRFNGMQIVGRNPSFSTRRGTTTARQHWEMKCRRVSVGSSTSQLIKFIMHSVNGPVRRDVTDPSNWPKLASIQGMETISKYRGQSKLVTSAHGYHDLLTNWAEFGQWLGQMSKDAITPCGQMWPHTCTVHVKPVTTNKNNWPLLLPVCRTFEIRMLNIFQKSTSASFLQIYAAVTMF